jgi:hypothetical protein
MSGVRDFGIAANLQRSAETALHHFTLAFGPVVLAPGCKRPSSPTFSPGTGSPLAVEPVDAQPLNPQMASPSKANIERYFIQLGT